MTHTPNPRVGCVSNLRNQLNYLGFSRCCTWTRNYEFWQVSRKLWLLGYPFPRSMVLFCLKLSHSRHHQQSEGDDMVLDMQCHPLCGDWIGTCLETMHSRFHQKRRNPRWLWLLSVLLWKYNTGGIFGPFWRLESWRYSKNPMFFWIESSNSNTDKWMTWPDVYNQKSADHGLCCLMQSTLTGHWLTFWSASTAIWGRICNDSGFGLENPATQRN